MTLLLPLWVALCGALATRGLDRENTVRWPLALVLGPAVGFGALSLLYFLCRLVGVSVARFQGLGWLLISRGIPYVEATRAGLVLLLQPALAFVWDILFFARPIGETDAVGALLALSAIYFGGRRRGRDDGMTG